MVDWKNIVSDWQRDFHISVRSGATVQLLNEFEQKCPPIPFVPGFHFNRFTCFGPTMANQVAWSNTVDSRS